MQHKFVFVFFAVNMFTILAWFFKKHVLYGIAVNYI